MEKISKYANNDDRIVIGKRTVIVTLPQITLKIAKVEFNALVDYIISTGYLSPDEIIYDVFVQAYEDTRNRKKPFMYNTDTEWLIAIAKRKADAIAEKRDKVRIQSLLKQQPTREKLVFK